MAKRVLVSNMGLSGYQVSYDVRVCGGGCVCVRACLMIMRRLNDTDIIIVVLAVVVVAAAVVVVVVGCRCWGCCCFAVDAVVDLYISVFLY